MSADIILSRLEKVRQAGQNKWMACCPAHDDKTPSLSIAELPDGRILMKCFAGCGASEVMATLSLSITDLFPDDNLSHYRSFVDIENEVKQRSEKKQNERIDNEALVAEIAASSSKKGERLSPKERERAIQAWRRSRADNR